MKKRIVTVLFTVILASTMLAACGSKPDAVASGVVGTAADAVDNAEDVANAADEVIDTAVEDTANAVDEVIDTAADAVSAFEGKADDEIAKFATDLVQNGTFPNTDAVIGQALDTYFGADGEWGGAIVKTGKSYSVTYTPKEAKDNVSMIDFEVLSDGTYTISNIWENEIPMAADKIDTIVAAIIAN